MRSFKKVGVLAVAVLALSAVGAANAPAASFTASATGNFTGTATEIQVFTINGGQIKCAKGELSGSISSTSSMEQHVTIHYKNCTVFGFANVHISPATFVSTANGMSHIANTITINTTLGCHVTIKPQTRGTLSFINSGTHITTTPHVTGITYTSTGGICGAPGSNGTATGNRTVSLLGGGSISHHP